MKQLQLPKKQGSLFWQAYSTSTKDDEVRAMFVERFGHEPQEVRRNGGAVLAGPLTTADLESKKNGDKT